jgi:hypothetical protein
VRAKSASRNDDSGGHTTGRIRVRWLYDRLNEVPEQLRKRMLTVRSFDGNGMMIGRSLAEGRELETAIEEQLAPPNVAYLHIPFAAPGCYAARVERA